MARFSVSRFAAERQREMGGLLSRRAKEAIKTGLAMAVAYGIALSMDWEKPQWAGIAVAVISLSTAGQSLNKGAMRILGSLVAISIALLLISLFSQDRWLLMVALSLHIAICTYKMVHSRYQYFWFVSAFVCIIILVSSELGAGNAFYTAVERTQETALGVLVYGLIAAFIWPQSSRANLEATGRSLLATQGQLFRGYLALVGGKGSEEDLQAARMQEVRLLGQFGPMLAAAETDNYEVFELRYRWRHLHDDAIALAEALERWRESFPEIRELELSDLFPDFQSFCDELDKRFSAIEAILSGEKSAQPPRPVSLASNQTGIRELTHFQQAAVAVNRSQLLRIEELSGSILQTVRDIKGLSAVPEASRRGDVQRQTFVIDSDRLIVTLRVVATLWIAFVLWLYVDPPGHDAFVQMATIFAMIFAMAPVISPVTLLLPFASGSAFAGVIYVFIMPQLSGYTELGLMIFVVTAVIYYVFAKPQQALAKMAAIITFIVLISVHNEQTYSFSAYANSTAMILLGIALNVFMAYIPTSPRPEKVFLRLFVRFFRQVDFMLARIALDWEQTAGISGRMQKTLYSGNLIDLYRKLATHGPRIDSRSFPDTPPAKVQALVTSLGGLAFRMKELLDVRQRPQAELVVRELLDDLRAWRLAIREYLQLWAEDPEAASREATDLQECLARRLAILEARVDETFKAVGEDEVSAKEYENLYHLLGSFRGLSEAGIAFAEAARGVNWGQLREARF